MLDDPWFNDWRFKIQICAPFIIAAAMIILVISEIFIDIPWAQPIMFILTIVLLISGINLLNLTRGYNLHRSGPK